MCAPAACAVRSAPWNSAANRPMLSSTRPPRASAVCSRASSEPQAPGPPRRRVPRCRRTPSVGGVRIVTTNCAGIPKGSKVQSMKPRAARQPERPRGRSWARSTPPRGAPGAWWGAVVSWCPNFPLSTLAYRGPRAKLLEELTFVCTVHVACTGTSLSQSDSFRHTYEKEYTQRYSTRLVARSAGN